MTDIWSLTGKKEEMIAIVGDGEHIIIKEKIVGDTLKTKQVKQKYYVFQCSECKRLKSFGQIVYSQDLSVIVCRTCFDNIAVDPEE